MVKKNGKIFIMLEEVMAKAKALDGDPFGLEPIKALISALLRGTDHFCGTLLAELARVELKHEGMALFLNEQMSADKFDEFTLMAVHNVNRNTQADVGKVFTFPVSEDGLDILDQPDMATWDFFLGIREKPKTPDKKGRIFAILALNKTEIPPENFEPEHWAIINELGNYLAWLFDQKGFIDHLSLIDEKTGAWNARWLRRKIHELELLRLEERLGTVTFVFLDVDHYKKINDERGHLFADLAIGHLYDQLRRCFKKTDAIARYGKGDEFVIVCLDATSRDILRRFMGNNNEEGLLHKATTWDFPHDGKRIDGFELSIGIAELKPEDGNLMEVLRRADKLQGLVKQTGKLFALADHDHKEIARRQAMIAPK